MDLELTRRQLATACQQAEVFGSEVLDPHNGRDGSGPGLTLPVGQVPAFLAALALILAYEGSTREAANLATWVRTEPKGRAVVAYWPGAVLTG
jgi:hypothetical protein